MLFPDKFIRHASKEEGTSVVNAIVEPVGSSTAIDGDAAPSTPFTGISTSIVHHEPPGGWLWERVRYEITSPRDIVRQYYNPELDLPKLLFQTVTLLTYLHDGFPIAIICVYSCLLFITWMLTTYRYKVERPDPHFVLARLFYSFDLFFAVFAPLEVLIYAVYNFEFNRAEFATVTETLRPGSFDDNARLHADPTEISVFRIAFHYLEFTSPSTLLIKSGLNLLSLFKWMRTIVHLVEHSLESP